MDLEHLGLLLRPLADLLLRRHRDQLRPGPEEPPGVAGLTRRHPETGAVPCMDGVHGPAPPHVRARRAGGGPRRRICRLSRG
ncbi:hypothetical protein SCOCK_20332 [Actinacidiphila cocklensis]|uniref:Uncharacterized protein n=1 Tax=Actinacidiphila cocklensis TaxID=887465 RepID=A0A9W4GQ91_9ACTN|nr:hypothetical protein SCOCK_20332 [Actinacidiphila cocklensis]